jgi:putative methyltransferase (TIGR04325 family)
MGGSDTTTETLRSNTPATASLEMDATDYPVLYHLDHILRPGTAVLDFGGNIGIHFLRYEKYLDLRQVDWIVCEVPEIAKIGRERCDGKPNLSFITDIAELEERRIDIFHSSGALQYLNQSILAALLDKLRPAYALIDQMPLCSGPTFVTLQNGGLVYYPQYVFDKEEYIEGILDLNYQLADAWSVLHYSCIIPFHADRSVYAYTGLCFSTTDISR